MFLFEWLPAWIFQLALIIGFIGVIGSALLERIPFIKDYAIYVKIICVIALVGGVAFQGYNYANKKHEKEILELQVKNEKLVSASKDVTIQEVTKYVDRVKIVKEKGNEIIKEIPVYITNVADNNCVLTAGVVLSHNTAASGISGASKDSDGTAKTAEANPIDPDTKISLKLSEYQTYITENYIQYNLLAEQLVGLQSWVTEQQKLFEENK